MTRINQMFPFHYSSLNYDLVQSTPSGSLNILWNQLNQKSIANSMMYMTPTFDFSIGYEYSEFNGLLNPMLAIQQTMQSFQNGNWMNGMGGMTGGMGFPSFNGFGNNWPNNWTFPWSGNNTGSASGGNSEYNALRALIQKYKEIGTKNNSISPTLLDKINNALNKSGKQEEKLQALKDLYNDLNKDKLEKALLELPEYKNVLKTAGYKFNGTNKDEDTALKKEINTLEQDLKNKKGDRLKNFTVSDDNPDILRRISYWNDTHKTDADRGIIRMVANNLPSEESELTLLKDGVNNIAMSLINKVEDFKAEMSGDFSKLDAAKENVSKALTTASKKFNKENLLKLAKETDTLYAMLRIMEAEKIKNTIKTKYSFLNNISSTDKDIADDKVVVEDTKADLRAEGIKTIPSTDVIPEEKVEEDIDERCETAEEKVEELVKEEKLKATEKEGVYKSASSSSAEPAKFYRVKDDQLVELKNVKAIDKSGNCTMKDGSKKALKDVQTVETTAQDVVDYNNTLNQIETLKKDGEINVANTSKMQLPAGEKLYYSKGLKANGKHQYFMIRGNKLMEIDCESVSKNGWIDFADGTKKHIKDVTDSDFVEVTYVKTTDESKNTSNTTTSVTTKGDPVDIVEDEIFDKEYEPLGMSQNDVDNADKIADNLMANTTDEEWYEAKTLILREVNADNVHTIISRYASHEGAGTDNILEQIATEQQCPDDRWGWWKDFCGEWGEDRRSSKERKDLINHIIKAVLDHCKKYGVKNEYAYKQLEEKYNNGKGITVDDIDNKAETTIRKLDQYILSLVKRTVNVDETSSEEDE